jgi:hypothetical protein
MVVVPPLGLVTLLVLRGLVVIVRRVGVGRGRRFYF